MKIEGNDKEVIPLFIKPQIHHDETHVSFVIHDNLVHLKPNTKISIGNWQYVSKNQSNTDYFFMYQT